MQSHYIGYTIQARVVQLQDKYGGNTNSQQKHISNATIYNNNNNINLKIIKFNFNFRPF